MCRLTFTAIEKVPLETPYGTVHLLFESLQKCVVLLPDQYTEPPTSPLTIDGVTVEGGLVFELWGRLWECQRDDERSRCYDVATDCRISRELRDKLAQKLSSCLRRWVKANPDAMQAINKALQRQAIERLQAEMSHIDEQIDVLTHQKAAKQTAMQKLQQQLDKRADP